MAVCYTHWKGFKIIKLLPFEARKIGFGIKEGCVCMGCNEIIKNGPIFYIAVLNDVMDLECLTEYLSSAEWYEEDKHVERNNYNRILSYLAAIDCDIQIEEDIDIPVEFIKREGCTAGSLSVDGIEEIDMNNSQRKALTKRFCKWLEEHPEQFNYFLQEIIPALGDYTHEDSKPCECCGDIVTEYTLVI